MRAIGILLGAALGFLAYLTARSWAEDYHDTLYRGGER